MSERSINDTPDEKKPMRMREKIVLRVVSQMFMPYILLFALYVQFHGDFGPGGGFQAGVIFAASFILYGVIFGLQVMRHAVPEKAMEIGMALGVTIYGVLGVVCMLNGGNFLDYDALNSHHPSHGQHWGILIIELGVGITVACGMISIFYALAKWGEQQ